MVFSYLSCSEPNKGFDFCVPGEERLALEFCPTGELMFGCLLLSGEVALTDRCAIDPSSTTLSDGCIEPLALGCAFFSGESDW